MAVSNLTSAPYWINNPYQFYVEHTIPAILSAAEFEEFNKIGECYAYCFRLAKENNIELAIAPLEEGDALLKKANPLVKDMVSIFCFPHVSYYYYSTGNHKLAISKTKHIIKKIKELEQNDHEYLFFCRLQQKHNLGRIYWTLKDAGRSVPIYADAILDIYLNADNWTTTKMISDVPETEVIEATQYLFILQILSEACRRFVLGFPYEEAVSLTWLRIFLRPLSELNFGGLRPHDPRYGEIDRFIAVLKALTDGREELFLAEATSFIDDELSHPALQKIICKYLYHLKYI